MGIKLIGSFITLAAFTILGIVLAKNKTDRVKQLRSLISALNILEMEIKFALTELADVFIKISKVVDSRIGEIFLNAANLILNSNINASEAWQVSLNQSMPNLCINREDKDILTMLGNSLGEVDTENQIKNIRLIMEQLKHQESKAEEQRARGEKLFKNLGFLSGLAVVIILF